MPVIPLVIALCCCGYFAAAMVNTSMRAIGLPPTYTPRSTVPLATSTTTVRPTETPTPTLQPTKTSEPTVWPTETPTSKPTRTPTPKPTKAPTIVPTATPTLTSGPRVIILGVNKHNEYVDLKNIGGQPQDLTGWKLVSVKGNQVCELRDVVIQPGGTLRVWTNNPNGGGYNCGFRGNIWNDNEPDPAVLYDAQGVEVSRYP